MSWNFVDARTEHRVRFVAVDRDGNVMNDFLTLTAAKVYVADHNANVKGQTAQALQRLQWSVGRLIQYETLEVMEDNDAWYGVQ